MGKIKQNVQAFKTANKVYFLVKKFNKEFLELMQDEEIEKKLEMYQLCIKYMKESLNKRFVK